MTDKDKSFACLCAMLLFSSRQGGGTGFSCATGVVYELFLRLTDSVFRGKITPQPVGERTCVITDEKQKRLLEDRVPFIGDSGGFSFARLGKIRQDAFFAGIFLACGGISNPEKEYHLEFFPPTQELSTELHSFMLSKGINAKLRESGSVYVKDSESIADALALMGAGMSAMQLMDAKIIKELKNLTNRRVNCDNANIEKALAASGRQLEAIRKIRDSIGGLEALPPPLRELAQLRLDNPESSMGELGEMLSRPIGRAGVNRRMQKLREIADSL